MFMSTGQMLSQKSKVSWQFPLYQCKSGPSIGIPLERFKHGKKQSSKEQGCR